MRREQILRRTRRNIKTRYTDIAEGTTKDDRLNDVENCMQSSGQGGKAMARDTNKQITVPLVATICFLVALGLQSRVASADQLVDVSSEIAVSPPIGCSPDKSAGTVTKKVTLTNTTTVRISAPLFLVV